MNQDWNMEELEAKIYNSAKQLLMVSVILIVVSTASLWLQQWFSWLAIASVLLALSLFTFIKVVQIFQWQKRINKLMRRK
ncbi:hypothetical protein CHL76_12100 [Marinococcus halophilus]|uniref:Uncharacterized protein n=1 Tax=Marinococcus halophilus TaxID=1371 RepID=A0A510Y9P8_MARHA|nr:hypothetical protein [Marinococcus halophilus]OZT79647.1 hypothetical protein CHL76_12100 [Marinococcus halophilus]GEK59411.1 hypothetical protein MHA01_23160 [Marinococcus halophilus]